VDISERVPLPEGVCMSWGSASSGLLINGVQYPSSPGSRVRRSGRDWATPETVEALLYAIETVQVTYPGSPDIYIGDLSRPGGGTLRPHVSHQNGRDVDLGFYFNDGKATDYFVNGSAANIDVPRTWTLIEAMIENGKVEYIFLDYNLQEVFYTYCRDNLKKSQAFLDTVFQYPQGRHDRGAIIRHARGHQNHLHVRFYCPRAVASASGYSPTQIDYQLARQGQAIGSGSSIDYQPGAARPRSTAAYRPARRDAAHAATASRQTPQRPSGPSLIYVVAEGESLSTIASRFTDSQVTPQNIRNWNSLARNERLQPGQALVVYTAEVPSLPERELSMEDMLASNDELVIEQQVHRIRPGDSLWTISRRYNCRMSDLCLWNGIKPSDRLDIGQLLIVKRVTRKVYASLPFATDAQLFDEIVEPEAAAQPANQAPSENRPCN